jgi:hypothetical protein
MPQMHIARTTVCTTRERNPRGGGRARWGNRDMNVGRGLSRGTSLPPRAALPGETRDCRGAVRQEPAGGGSMWGLDGVGVAVGWRVGAVGRAEGASVNGFIF